MRDKLGGFHQRGCGPVDPRISPLQSTRKPNYTPDGIVNAVGTPVVWLDPEVVSMTEATAQPTFTDRAGVTWTLTGFSGSRAMWQMPNAMNGRNCWRSTGPDDTDSDTGITCMDSTAAITLGPNLTSFHVIRCLNYGMGNSDGTARIFMRQQVSIGTGTDNYFWFQTSDFKFNFDRVDLGQVSSAAGGGPGAIQIVTVQSQQTRNEIWLNGVVGTNANPGTTPTNPRILYWGCYPTAPRAYVCQMDYGDIIIYNSILSATDRNAVEKYLGRKYGVTVA